MSPHKGRIAIAVGMLLVALQVGCSQKLAAGGRNVFRPGEKWLLTYRAELVERGVAVSETRMRGSDGTDELVERVETPYASRTWTLIELPVAVRLASEAGHVDVLMTIQRVASGSYDDDQLPTTTQDSTSPPADYAEQLEYMALSATLDRGGRIVALDPQGEMFADLSIEELRKEIETSPEADDMFATRQEAMAFVQRQYDAAARLRSMGAYSALDAVAPYLPTQDVAIGDTWPVHRDRVYPGQAYAFLMITNGATYSSERATCVVKSVEETAEERLATVEITGRRVPGPRGIPGAPEEDMESRVDFLELTGELVFNLDTRDIVTLRIATDPHFVIQEDSSFDIQFVDTISLRRLD